jgi:hypothetical protein
MGVLGNFRDAVTLINRTDRNLNVRYDGEDITLKPGENPGFPKVAVSFAKKQNPLKGTLHPNGNMNSMVFLVGVKDTKDAIDPISESVLRDADAKLELFDRDGSYHGEEMRKVKLLKKTGYSPYEAQASIGSFDVNSAIE